MLAAASRVSNDGRGGGRGEYEKRRADESPPGRVDHFIREKKRVQNNIEKKCRGPI